MVDGDPRASEKRENDAVEALKQNKKDEAQVHANLAVSAAVNRLADAVEEAKKDSEDDQH